MKPVGTGPFKGRRPVGMGKVKVIPSNNNGLAHIFRQSVEIFANLYLLALVLFQGADLLSEDAFDVFKV